MSSSISLYSALYVISFRLYWSSGCWRTGLRRGILETADGTGFFRVVIFSVFGSLFLSCGVIDLRWNDVEAGHHSTSYPIRSGDQFWGELFLRQPPELASFKLSSSLCLFFRSRRRGRGWLAVKRPLAHFWCCPHVVVTSRHVQKGLFRCSQYLDLLSSWTRKLGLSFRIP